MGNNPETMAREIVRKHVGFLQVETQQKMIDEIVAAMKRHAAQKVLEELRARGAPDVVIGHKVKVGT